MGIVFFSFILMLRGNSFAAPLQPMLSVVQIESVEGHVLGIVDGKLRKGTVESSAHGIVVDASGIIATNTHVIKGAKHIYVHFANGETYPAVTVYFTNKDFSFLKINPSHKIFAIPWGDSNSVHPGMPIFTLPSSMSDVLTGTVSRRIKDSPSRIEFLELLLKIKPGDSGSPVLDRHGSLLGLIMGNRRSDRTISYAISSNQILKEFLKVKSALRIS
jgi:S1-C subfamily serine protease